VVFPQFSVKFPEKSMVVLKNFDKHYDGSGSAFERRLVQQCINLIDASNQVFFVVSVLSQDSIPNAMITGDRLCFSMIVPPLSNKDIEIVLGRKFDEAVINAAVGLSIGQIVHASTPEEIYQESIMTNIRASVAKVHWDDIGGLSETKRVIREAVEWPLTRAKELKEFGIKPPRGILLYGPPGCGKTMIARAIATSLTCSFFAISAASVFQMYLGESERIIRELFALAQQKSPAVVFVDEIDSIVAKRGQVTGVSERILSTFLNEMDGITGLDGVIVVGATNRKDALDDALCRPGRFDCLIEVKPCCNVDDVKEVLRVCVRKMPVGDEVVNEIAQKIGIGRSGAEIDNICREAALIALQEGSDVVNESHFLTVINKL
jgi:ATP-dependent 26S proteasome regulatory subunit